MARYELTEFEWKTIQPLLPNKPRGVLVAQEIPKRKSEATVGLAILQSCGDLIFLIFSRLVIPCCFTLGVGRAKRIGLTCRCTISESAVAETPALPIMNSSSLTGMPPGWR